MASLKLKPAEFSLVKNKNSHKKRFNRTYLSNLFIRLPSQQQLPDLYTFKNIKLFTVCTLYYRTASASLEPGLKRATVRAAI